MGVMKTLTINGVKYDVVPSVPTSYVTLLASAWESTGDEHFQVVEVPNVTSHTKVDLQPTAEQLAEFHYKVLCFVAENDGGTVTVYAIGDKPANDHTIQITLTEVAGTGKIRGNTVGTTMPRPDWAQTDPTKADYIKNKPEVMNGGSGVTSWNDLTDKPDFALKSEMRDLDERVTHLEQNGGSGGSGGTGVTSWNDLRDKPFYEEPEMVTLFEEQDVSFSYDSGFGVYVAVINPPVFTLRSGETYTVRWDGVEYVCQGDTITLAGMLLHGVGNRAFQGGENTGEPFAIASQNADGVPIYNAMMAADAESSHRVGIFKEVMAVTPLDAKFLPMDAIDARIDAYIEEAMGGDY